MANIHTILQVHMPKRISILIANTLLDTNLFPAVLAVF